MRPRPSGSGILAPSKNEIAERYIVAPGCREQRRATRHDNARPPATPEIAAFGGNLSALARYVPRPQLQHGAFGCGAVDGALQGLRLIVDRVGVQSERGGIDARTPGVFSASPRANAGVAAPAVAAPARAAIRRRRSSSSRFLTTRITHHVALALDRFATVGVPISR